LKIEYKTTGISTPLVCSTLNALKYPRPPFLRNASTL
jgi:hypothetical protein